MLIVSRKNTESILIHPAKGVDPNLTLADIFNDGPIEITIFMSIGKSVKMGVQAPRQLSIWRRDNDSSGA